MTNECYVCNDWVSEYGDPICKGCYDSKKKAVTELTKEIAALREENRKLLTEYLNLQKKLKLK